MRKARIAAPEHKRAATREREKAAFLLTELKATNDNAGTFEGYVAVFNNLDQNGDVIEQGAFKRTLGMLRETKQQTGSAYLVPLLWQHDETEPIGGITDAYEDAHGLHINGEYDLDTPRGAQAYSGAKKGYLRGLSIGYRTVKSMIGQQRERRLLEVQWFEGSPVTFPANTDAGINQVKSATGSTDWPIADRDTAWDSSAAETRLVAWAGGKDDLDAGKYKSVHMWFDDSDGDGTKLGNYKLPFCDVIGGSVKAVPKAIFAIAGVLNGARGGAQLGGDADSVKSKVNGYYSRMAKQFDDPSIEPPWNSDSKSINAHPELKQIAGLAALTACAQAADNSADSACGIVELLVNACGLSMDGSGGSGTPAPAVAALLAGVDGLLDAVKAVLTSYMEWSQQTDALLAVLGLPDNDNYPQETYVSGYGYMSQLREAFESKTGRQLSQTNRDRLQAHAQALQSQVNEVKSILKDNDNPLGDENQQSDDYGDYIASGAHNKPPTSGGKGLHRDSDGSRTTPPSATEDPETAKLLSTLQQMQDAAATRQLLATLTSR